jgi:hypothetical protein
MTTTLKDVDREHEMANGARQSSAPRRSARRQAFTSLESGDPEMTADFDVDAFLRQVREDRNRSSNLSVE